ncbi:MAG: capsular biosynthesis protein [Hyphomonadaceae bacterium]
MVQLIFDDTLEAPDEIKASVGVERFGGIVFRRRSLVEFMRGVTRDAGWPPLIHLRGKADSTALMERVRADDADALYLVCPSHLVAACAPDALSTFLQQIEYAPTALYMFLEDARGRRGWALMRAPMFYQFLVKLSEGKTAEFFEEHDESFVHVHDRLPLIDLSDEPMLQEYLSGQFEARHFNAVERDRYTVVKRSQDRAKLKQEYEFYYHLPPVMQTFLVQPFDFQDDGDTASYRMERIGMPDVATQWVHGAIHADEFERFLAHVFYFLDIRKRREASKADVQAGCEFLYGKKIAARMETLKAHPDYLRLAPLLARLCGGVDALVARYFSMLNEYRRRTHLDHLVIGHGDLCFSNIFYSKTIQHLKLIDPRGAADEAGLYMDPYYDVAKLSHSIQGGYDFINHDKFELLIDDGLQPSLRIENPAPAWAGAMFQRALMQAGFDPVLVRLYEASLFISMLPLHMDRPRKVLAFAVNAVGILNSLSRQKGPV